MMDSKHPIAHRKRKVRHVDDDAWDCTVCTYKNSAEAFRCDMCQTRKGTSTRKPKLNQQIVEEQSLIARTIIKERHDGEDGGGPATHANSRRRRDGRAMGRNPSGTLPGFGNVDRSSPLMFEIFANGYSVVITEFKPKSMVKRSFSVPDSPAPSNASSLLGFTSTPLGGGNSDQLSPLDQASCGLSVRTSQFPEFHDEFSTTSSLRHLTLPDENNNQSSSADNSAPNSSSNSSSLDIKSVQDCVDEEIPVPNRTSSWVPPSSSPTTLLSSRKRKFSSSLSRYITSPLGRTSPSRSLRSSLFGSKTRQASKIARASLYQNAAENHSYKRRRVLHFRQPRQRNSVVAVVNRKAIAPSDLTENSLIKSADAPPTADPELSLTEVLGKPNESKNTTAMTDSCGASTLEMST